MKHSRSQFLTLKKSAFLVSIIRVYEQTLKNKCMDYVYVFSSCNLNTDGLRTSEPWHGWVGRIKG